ncbi:MAG: hypothetical protein JWO36_6783 [Myxococcales bacterium]|nr:hypothetical protein [Myxococcales bacterium]
MNTVPMRTVLLIAGAALLVPVALAAGPKKGDAPSGGPIAKAPSACGSKILPLSEGNEWTYTPIAAPQAAIDQIARISPTPAASIVITVKSIDAKKGADTVVTLEEKISVDLNKDLKKPPQLDTHTVTSTITCNAKKFEISPNSFFFAGEPGGYFNLELDKIERPKGTTWQLTNGSIGDAEWREDLVAHWSRTPTPNSEAKLGAGKLELERRFTPQQPEKIITKLASYTAEKLGLITTGRVTLENPQAPDAKPFELPAGWVSQVWLVENVGVVQTLNTYAHMYQLSDAKLK